MKKQYFTLLLVVAAAITQFTYAQKGKTVVFETTKGTIKVLLYDETPMHKENFEKLVSDGYYNGVLFHRVIKNFMIQTGDPNSKNAKPGEMLGMGGPTYTVPAEFHPSRYHKKGALAAARQGDHVNPGKASSGSQFYIVHGEILTDAQLSQMEANGMHIPFTAEQRKQYTTVGGTPHLDYAYTVFGEVLEGIDIVEQIATSATDKNSRPLEDIKIIRAFLK